MSQSAIGSQPSVALSLVRLLRPHQWIKNGFVFVGVMFGHGWRNPDLLLEAVLAAAAFCLAASAIYALNDVIDAESDRAHPTKRSRPVASGAISARTAVAVSVLLACSALGVSALVAPVVVGIVLAYLAINVAYALKLKHVVILDVYCIAAGFMLRILAGTLGIGLAPSNWLLLCSSMLTLFLGFAKRHAELSRVGAGGGSHTREVLDHYSLELLDKLIVVAAAGTVITYGLYTMDAQTIALHHTDRLIYTVPVVMYGLFRYLYLLHQRQLGEDTSAELYDGHLVVSVIIWALLSVLLIA